MTAAIASVLVEQIQRWQDKIRLTSGHRYQVLSGDGRWEFVLGTTTVIKQTLAAPQLLDWAARIAYEQNDPKAHIKVRDKAGDQGTSLHALIERECRLMMAGETVAPMPPATEEELMALARWKRWAKDVDFEPLAVEFRVYHAGLGYAGTVDVLGRAEGVLGIGDWKSGRVFQDHHLQNVAYRAALAHMTGTDPLPGFLVRVPRDGDVVTHKPGTKNYEGTLRAFEGLIAANLWQREIRREMDAA